MFNTILREVILFQNCSQLTKVSVIKPSSHSRYVIPFKHLSNTFSECQTGKVFRVFFFTVGLFATFETKLQYNIFGLFLIWNAQLTYFVSVKQAKHNAPVLLTITSPVYLRTLSFF